MTCEDSHLNLAIFIFLAVSSEEMSVRAGQGSDEVLVSQAVWDYLAAAGRRWLLEFEDKEGLSAGIIRRGERGGCCAVRLQPVEGSSQGRARMMEGPVSPATRKAFIDLCRCARKEMTKLDGAPKRKRSLLPCVGGLELDGEGSLLPPSGPLPQPRRSQRQQQRSRRSSDLETCLVIPTPHHGTTIQPRTEAEASPMTPVAMAVGTDMTKEESSSTISGSSCPICMGELVDKTTLEKCGHTFCRICLDQAFLVKRACPVCRLVYGQLIGNQPANGTMMVERDPDLELPGHEGYGCICIIYSFPPGLQAVSSSEQAQPSTRC